MCLVHSLCETTATIAAIRVVCVWCETRELTLILFFRSSLSLSLLSLYMIPCHGQVRQDKHNYRATVFISGRRQRRDHYWRSSFHRWTSLVGSSLGLRHFSTHSRFLLIGRQQWTCYRNTIQLLHQPSQYYSRYRITSHGKKHIKGCCCWPLSLSLSLSRLVYSYMYILSLMMTIASRCSLGGIIDRHCGDFIISISIWIGSLLFITVCRTYRRKISFVFRHLQANMAQSCCFLRPGYSYQMLWCRCQLLNYHWWSNASCKSLWREHEKWRRGKGWWLTSWYIV